MEGDRYGHQTHRAFVAIVLIVFASVGVTSPQLVKNIKLGLDLKGGFEILYVAEPIEAGKPVTRESLNQTALSLEQRANALGVTEPEVTTEGSDRIRVKFPGVSNEEEVRKVIKEPAQLTFRGPDGTKELIGSDFVENAAKVQFDQTNRAMIQIEVKDKEKFRKVTEKLLGQPMSIYLDETPLSSPIVQQVLTDGKATITGNFTFDEAKKLADTINLGALPLKLTEKYTQSVGASLGQLSLQETVKAGLVGSVLILLFMLFFYRIPGLVASITIITYAWLLLLVFNLIHATLTLPASQPSSWGSGWRSTPISLRPSGSKKKSAAAKASCPR